VYTSLENLTLTWVGIEKTISPVILIPASCLHDPLWQRLIFLSELPFVFISSIWNIFQLYEPGFKLLFIVWLSPYSDSLRPDGPGIESRLGRLFRTTPDGLWDPPSLLYNGYRVFSGGRGGLGVNLTTHHQLVQRSWKSWAIFLLPLWARVACCRVKYYLIFYSKVSLVALLVTLLSSHTQILLISANRLRVLSNSNSSWLVVILWNICLFTFPSTFLKVPTHK